MQQDAELSVVTGAFGYTGRHIAARLLVMGKQVRTITGHPQRRNPFGDQVAAFPFSFDNPAALVDSLKGATTLYNTYWVRFPQGDVTFDRAVENSRTLIRAAEEAGVRRIVHISITNADADSPLPYFRSKGLVEQAVTGSRLSYAIVRPTVIYGGEDILINNIAWLLRRFPLFAIAGSGDYRVQPVYVEDVADLATRLGDEEENIVADAVGPEIYTFNELVQLIAEKIRSRARIIHLPPSAVFRLAQAIGYIVKDVVLTRDEIEGLSRSLLVSAGPSTGRTRISDWLESHANTIGVRYASELQRHYKT